ncbi:MAG: hypothetical protein QOE33_1295 [Acidobacteriota bacterium]|nr:hypothetical protein [Acidobacteriota bacterium]
MPLAAQHARRVRRGGAKKVARATKAQEANATQISFASGTSATNITFELYANVIFVEVRVNDSAPLSFIFDTGAGINVLNASRAADLRLARASVGVNAKGTGGTVAGSLATGATISLPGVSVRGQRIAVLPLQSLEPRVGRRVDGILGYDFIREFVTEIDYERKLISLHDPRTYRPALRGTVVPFDLRRGTPYVNTTIYLSNSDRVNGEFEIDTGSDSALGIYDYFVKAHGLRRRLPRVSGPQAGEGIGGETSYVEARVKSFRLGRYSIEHPVVGLSQGDNEGSGGRPEYDGTIGTEVFRRFHVVIDYTRRRLALAPNAHFREPYETDMSGIDLIAEGEDFRAFRIAGITPATPASEAGVRAGDVLTEIDGRAASSFTLDEITQMFARAGRVYALTLRRGDETLRVSIKLRRMI